MASFFKSIKDYLFGFVWTKSQPTTSFYQDNSALLLIESESDKNDFEQYNLPSDLTNSAYMLYYLTSKTTNNSLENEMKEFVEIV